MSNGRQRKDYELGLMDELWASLKRHEYGRRQRVLNWLHSKSDEQRFAEARKDFADATLPGLGEPAHQVDRPVIA